MKQYKDIYKNLCYRNGACLFSEPIKVEREQEWDYFDTRRKSFISLDCKLHQKYYLPSAVEIENRESYLSGIPLQAREHPDLQLHDSDGVWFTRSDDPKCYYWPPDVDEKKTCNLCDIICEIRDWDKYLTEDGSCPYNDNPPGLGYWKVQDYDRVCENFLHPLLLQNIDSINRKKRKAAKAKIWKYLKEPKWMHTLINSGQTMKEVWERNYKPVTFYFNSFETILLYIKNSPENLRKNKTWLKHIRKNLEKSPSFEELLRESWYEEELLERIDKMMKEME